MADLSKLEILVDWRVVLLTDAIVLVEFTFPWGTRLVGYEIDRDEDDDERDDDSPGPDIDPAMTDTLRCRCSIALVLGGV